MALFSYTIINFQKIFYNCILEDIFFDLTFPAALQPRDRLRNTEISTRCISWRVQSAGALG